MHIIIIITLNDWDGKRESQKPVNVYKWDLHLGSFLQSSLLSQEIILRKEREWLLFFFFLPQSSLFFCTLLGYRSILPYLISNEISSHDGRNSGFHRTHHTPSNCLPKDLRDLAHLADFTMFNWSWKILFLWVVATSVKSLPSR